jgi:hypothetical protein
MKIKNFIKRTWEVPQNILGAIVKKIFKAKYHLTYNGAKVHTWNIAGGLSLGNYIFIYEPIVDRKTGKNMIKHEYGHTIQSKYLGWLYLLVIGLPSLIWAWCFEGYRTKHGKSYYDFYTESWANKLGGVDAE